MRKIEAGLVEQHIAEPPTEHDTEGDVEEEVIEIERRQFPARPLHQPAEIEPPEHQPGDIGERVPPDRKRGRSRSSRDRSSETGSRV